MKKILLFFIFGIFLIGSLNFISSAWDASLNIGLAGGWDLNENTGTTGGGVDPLFNLTISEGTWTTGKVGYGVNISTGYMENAQALNVGTNTQYSVSFWIADTTSGGDMGYFIGDKDSDLNRMIRQDTQGYGYYVGDNFYTGAATAPYSYVWVHLVCIVNATGHFLYKNGTRIGEAAGNTFEEFKIGNVEFGDPARTTDERTFDSIYIWNRTITDAEILSLWNNGNGLEYGGATPETKELTVTINSPENNTVYSTAGIIFNLTLNPTSLELKNVTVFVHNASGVFNITTIETSGTSANDTVFNISEFVLGSYNVGAYGCGENGTFVNCSWAVLNNTFYIGAEILNLTYSENTYETARENFTLIIRAFPNSEISAVQLVYNGTNHTISDISNIGNDYTFSKQIDIPLNINPFKNDTKEFYFRFIYAGAFTQNSPIYDQNISFINIQICNATFNALSLNFTLFNENTLQKIAPSVNLTTTFKATFGYWIGEGDTYKNYSYQLLNSSTNANYSFCIYPYPVINGSLKARMSSIYSATDYSEREYTLYNSTLTNVSSDIVLYLLDDTEGEKFTITVKEGVTNLPNAIVTVSKYFIGEGIYKTVSIRQTDNNGQFIEYLDLDDDYRFFITRNGEYYGYVDRKAICKTAPCEMTLQTETGQSDFWSGYYDKYAANIISNITFDPATKIVTYEFIDITGLANYFRLEVNKVMYNETRSSICNVFSYSSAGTLTCNITGYDGDFIARTYISRSPEKIDKIFQFFITDLKETLGTWLIFIDILIIMTVVIAAAVLSSGNPSVVITVFGILILILKLAALFPFSWGIVGTIELIVIVLASMLKT
ncbi:MAG: LamG-like jellyroll fold domain-containing protein [Candidatus Thorarchaeota archaeon]